MQQQAKVAIGRAFSRSFIDHVYNRASRDNISPDVMLCSLYAINEESGDFDSTLKAAEGYLILQADMPLVNSGFDGDSPVRKRADALRKIGIDVTDDEMVDADTFLKLSRVIEKHYGNNGVKITA